MQTGHGHGNGQLGRVDKAVTGPLVDAGGDHFTVRDIAAGENIRVHIDDRTEFVWQDARQQGRLTDSGQVRVGYYYAAGVHTAAEVHVLDPGDGVPLSRTLHHSLVPLPVH